jgi:Na+/phosphate symporter
MALERARMELGHMAELTEGMLAKVRSAFKSRDLSELSQQHDQVVVLREAVLAYLQHVGRAELSDAEADEHARLVAATGDIENMSAAISRELAPLAQTLKEANITPSKETADLLERLFQTIQESAHSALQALVEKDERAAQTVVANRDAILELTSEFAQAAGRAPRPGRPGSPAQAPRAVRDTRQAAAHLQCGRAHGDLGAATERSRRGTVRIAF